MLRLPAWTGWLQVVHHCMPVGCSIAADYLWVLSGGSWECRVLGACCVTLAAVISFVLQEKKLKRGVLFEVTGREAYTARADHGACSRPVCSLPRVCCRELYRGCCIAVAGRADLVGCVGIGVEVGAAPCASGTASHHQSALVVCSIRLAAPAVAQAGAASSVPVSVFGVPLSRVFCVLLQMISARCTMLKCIALHVAQCLSALRAVVRVVAGRFSCSGESLSCSLMTGQRSWCNLVSSVHVASARPASSGLSRWLQSQGSSLQVTRRALPSYINHTPASFGVQRQFLLCCGWALLAVSVWVLTAWQDHRRHQVWEWLRVVEACGAAGIAHQHSTVWIRHLGRFIVQHVAAASSRSAGHFHRQQHLGWMCCHSHSLCLQELAAAVVNNQVAALETFASQGVHT